MFFPLWVTSQRLLFMLYWTEVQRIVIKLFFPWLCKYVVSDRVPPTHIESFLCLEEECILSRNSWLVVLQGNIAA